jgi:uncharacterized OB-fold protein
VTIPDDLAAVPGVPDPSHPLYGPFWGGCLEGFLNLPRCEACRYLIWPPAEVCPQCLERSILWTVVPGNGTVWSVAVYERGFTDELRARVPYACVLVELDAGPRLISTLVDAASDIAEPGLRVMATSVADPRGVRLPCFRPLDGPVPPNISTLPAGNGRSN